VLYSTEELATDFTPLGCDGSAVKARPIPLETDFHLSPLNFLGSGPLHTVATR
jgi:hypothetical protein